MKTDQKVLAQFLAAAINVDEQYPEEQQEVVKEIQDDFKLKGLTKDVDYYVKKFDSISEDEMSESLEEAGKNVNENEKDAILDLLLELLCVDGELALFEVENFFVFAEFLGIDEDDAEQILNEFVEDTEDLIIEEVDEEDEDDE